MLFYKVAEEMDQYFVEKEFKNLNNSLKNYAKHWHGFKSWQKYKVTGIY